MKKNKSKVRYNNLAVIHPELAKQWHPTKNGDLLPTQVTVGSGKKVWWQCDRGHEWPTTVANRTRGKGCPYCAGKQVIVGETDLATVNPSLASEWHPTKNQALQATQVTANSDKKVWWQCKHGHEWQATVGNRNRGSGCPYCAGKLPIVGETDLATVNPSLASQWHPIKNQALQPTQVTANSNKKVWWQCERGHEWRTTAHSRTSGHGCPYCAGQRPITGETDLVTVNPSLASQWHPTKNQGLQPTQVSANSKKKVWWQCKHGHEWSATITNRTKGRGCPYCAGKRAVVGETDLSTVNPSLAAQWHPTKNQDLQPTQVSANSKKKVWWQCERGHEWIASVNARAQETGCPYCAGKCAVVGETDLATVNPSLAAQWHPTKNQALQPTQVTANFAKKVWWQCERGHEWPATVNSRTCGKKCPYCAGKQAIAGETDLVTVNPSLASQWHQTKNGALQPTQVTANSNKKVWWRCEYGHEWPATVNNRNGTDGRECPYCAGKQPIVGETDLATVNPSLAAQWHPTKNGALQPTQVTANSGKSVWWQCEHGHEWKALVNSRTSGNGCPICKKRNNNKPKHI